MIDNFWATLKYDAWWWIPSYILAIASLVYSYLAAKSSTHANKKLEEIIQSSWLTTEASSYFYTQIKKLNDENKKIIEETFRRPITFVEYSALATHTRLMPIPIRTYDVMAKTEFKSLIKMYSEIKKELETKFKEIFPDLTMLQSTEFVQFHKVQEIKEYHKKIQTKCKLIMKEYIEVATKMEERHEDESHEQ